MSGLSSLVDAAVARRRVVRAVEAGTAGAAAALLLSGPWILLGRWGWSAAPTWQGVGALVLLLAVAGAAGAALRRVDRLRLVAELDARAGLGDRVRNAWEASVLPPERLEPGALLHLTRVAANPPEVDLGRWMPLRPPRSLVVLVVGAVLNGFTMLVAPPAVSSPGLEWVQVPPAPVPRRSGDVAFEREQLRRTGAAAAMTGDRTLIEAVAHLESVLDRYESGAPIGRLAAEVASPDRTGDEPSPLEVAARALDGFGTGRVRGELEALAGALAAGDAEAAGASAQRAAAADGRTAGEAFAAAAEATRGVPGAEALTRALEQAAEARTPTVGGSISAGVDEVATSRAGAEVRKELSRRAEAIREMLRRGPDESGSREEERAEQMERLLDRARGASGNGGSAGGGSTERPGGSTGTPRQAAEPAGGPPRLGRDDGTSSEGGREAAAAGAGGPGIGRGHVDNELLDPTEGAARRDPRQAAGRETGSGATTESWIRGAADGGFATSGYRAVFQRYGRVTESTMDREEIPPGYRYYVTRYFDLIRPRAGSEAP